MSKREVSTRRRFFGQAGAALSVPLAAATASAAGTQAGNSAARLAALEDAHAIRALQQRYAQLVNAGLHADAARLFAQPADLPVDGTIRRLAADRFATADVVDVAPGGKTAATRVECTVETQKAIDGSGTLIDMLRAQGEGTLRAVESRVLEGTYVKQGGEWKIASLALRPA
jgi:hypothetical protein